MDENIGSSISDYDYEDSDINYVCKICKELPQYAGMYLCQREGEKNKEHDEGNQRADLIQMKYYYALLYLLDWIHKLPECPDPKRAVSESVDQKCPTSEYFDRYRNMCNTYADILRSEKRIEKINLKCDICAVLPYAIFCDLDMVAKNMHNDEIEKTQKLELYKMITDFYLTELGPCEQWEECTNGVDWLELINSVQMLKKYLETKDRKELHIDLSHWNNIRANDNILNTGLKTTPKDFQTRDIPLSELEGKTLIYLDFGVYQLYESNEVFRTKLDTYAKMDKIQFVYSPTHMEEVCRMDNSEFERKRCDNISKICGDYEVLPVNDGYLKILAEPVDVCFYRAKKLQNLNQYAEESECAKFEAMEEQTYRLLKWDEKEMERRRKEISALTSIQLFDPKNETIDNKSLNRIFRCICGSQVSLEKYKDYIKKGRPFPEIREAIRLLYTLMNALGYHRNKIEKRTKFTHQALYPTYDRKFYRTIRSGFYDVDHLCYASKCGYFVTCDYALSLQAIEIYRYLGCETKVIYCEKKATDPSLPLAEICKKSNAT